jgi:hypothetical protein
MTTISLVTLFGLGIALGMYISSQIDKRL